MRTPRGSRVDTAKHLAATNCLVKNNDGGYVLSRVQNERVELLDTFSKRLEWLVKPIGGSEAARVLGLARATINTAIKKGSTSLDTLERLHRIAGVDLHWLVSGEGSPGPISWPPSPEGGMQKLTKRKRVGTARQNVGRRAR